MPEMTQNDTPTKTTHRKKNRESHNEVERHRKKKINSGINRIGDLIPCSPALKQSKNMILEQAFKYITELKRQNDELLLNGGDNEQATEIKKLRKELSELQKENGRYIELLKSNDICLYDDPTLHWKGKVKNSKASLVVSTDQIQKLPLCLNGNQLGTSNSSTAVHGITFNVGSNLQKQTANVVPVQRTCNLVTPITIPGVSLLEGKTWPQSAALQTSSTHHVPVCLPVTVPTTNTVDVSTSKGDGSFLVNGSSASHHSLISIATSQLHCSSNPASQEVNMGEKVGGHQEILPSIASSTSSLLPSGFSSLVSEVPLVSVSGAGLQESPNHFQGRYTGAVGCTVKGTQENFPNVNMASNPEATSTLRDVIPSAGEVNEVSAVGALSTTPVPNSWSINSLSVLDSKIIGNLTRVPCDGNTQTTWTTLQVAGSTIQPLSQAPPSVVPMVVTEQQFCGKGGDVSKQATPCINPSNPSVSETGTPAEQVIVKMSSCQPAQVQSLISQPQTATNILPLNPPVQVIQVAPPAGPTLNPVPANQNIIILQPPAPAPCPPVIRPEVPKSALGQQIVIIQAASNQNPLMSTQPAAPVVLPLNAANPIVCPSNPAQGTVQPQTFGGKHLVHILPRPTLLPPTSVPPVSTASPNQQPTTISLNGHLFSLQPVTPSSGSSSQTHMQIIQPTTSEDPNTNVALNTFGALANLSQSISQIAGQSCLQFTLNPPAPPLTNPGVPLNSAPTITPSTSAESLALLPATSTPSNAIPAKPSCGSPPSSKPKKGSKKPSAKKTAPTRKETVLCNKADRPVSVCLENIKPGNENPPVGMTPVPEKGSTSDAGNAPETNTEVANERDTLTVLNGDMEVPTVPESASRQPLTIEISSSTDLSSSTETDISINPNTQTSSSLAPDCFKPCAVNNLLAESTSKAPEQESIATAPAPAVEYSGGPSKVISVSYSVGDPNGLTATDLLEVQILSHDPKDKSPAVKEPTEGSAGKELAPAVQIKENVPGVPVIEPQLPGTLDSELGASSSVVTSRQTDSPMSSSSGSSRNFTVASMLPDAIREDMTNVSPPVFTGCKFTEQNSSVAAAGRATTDQEILPKRRPRLQGETSAAVPRNADLELVNADCRIQYKPQAGKESLVQQVTKPSSFPSLPVPSADRLGGKSSCPVGVSTADLPMHISSSQPQSEPSLSINNLIRHGNVTHSIVHFANAPPMSEQVTAQAPSNTPVTNYEHQTHGLAALSEYSQDQLHSMRSMVMQVSHTTESLLKASDERRKDSNKRPAHEDDLVAGAKRQKQLQAPLAIERMQPPGGLGEQNEMLVSPVPSSTSSSVTGSNPGHGEGLAALFTSANNFARQSDMCCGSQTSILEQQQGQLMNPHLQPLQQHPQGQHSLHHNNFPYLKQQQQQQQTPPNLLQEQHHLYQRQQHHVPHAESSVHPQSRNLQQQRIMQQDVQMQKKRPPVQSAQPTRMSLQQKQQMSEQNRPKGAQPHSHHQQIQQQMQPHFAPPQADKSCDNTAPNRNPHSSRPPGHVNQDLLHQHPDVGSRSQGSTLTSEHLPGHNQVQRLLTSRSMEQQMVSQASIVSQAANMTCAPHRQERTRVSSYSAEALIGKSPSNSEQRMGISIQSSRVPEQLEMRKYLDVSRNKSLSVHPMQGRLPVEHPIGAESQRLPDCQTFKPSGSSQQQPGSFEVQTSRNNEVNTLPSMRAMQAQAYRVGHNPNLLMDQQKHLSYQPVPEGTLSNAENSCHQSYMQSLLAPHIGEQVGAGQRLLPGHQRNTQYNPPSGIDYVCAPGRDSGHLRRDNDGQNRESCDMAVSQGTSRNHSLSIPFSSSTSSGDIPGRNTSPNVSMQKSNQMRPTDNQGAKNHLNVQVSINMHAAIHPPIPQQSVSHSNLDQRQNVRQNNPLVTHRSRHPLQEESESKARQPDRNRPGSQRHSNMFEPTLPHLPLTGPGTMILGRQQAVTDKRPGIVRFMPDSSQVSGDNSAPDQHGLTQNFAFPFIPEGTMNSAINTNASFIPPVTQTPATRTPALIPVDPQNTLPSFYPPYSPAHPSLPNDLTLPYFPNQMFPNPSTEKPNSTGLNNRFGSILSPPRPVGFSQTTFPLLPDMPPMHMTNPPHLSNFNLTSLFPEIATGLPADGSAMSPLLSISHSSGSDSSKQSSNRPAHNISHILGHDSSSAV
ncbi:hypothetical protein GDO86_020047 [Hymenochirus boettgeri]|uniref:BHLH domain-containing protein n=1 Tax=Hymenochirus boettgeri TaxID=247094 RepID=A0A8T2ICM3_9PIPI|nr:hypothetical protein GDO86_020047 [Hymenochirus boettgeri]